MIMLGLDFGRLRDAQSNQGAMASSLVALVVFVDVGEFGGMNCTHGPIGRRGQRHTPLSFKKTGVSPGTQPNEASPAALGKVPDMYSDTTRRGRAMGTTSIST